MTLKYMKVKVTTYKGGMVDLNEQIFIIDPDADLENRVLIPTETKDIPASFMNSFGIASLKDSFGICTRHAYTDTKGEITFLSVYSNGTVSVDIPQNATVTAVEIPKDVAEQEIHDMRLYKDGYPGTVPQDNHP